MSNNDSMFDFVASKLGVNNAAVVQKSKELYRLLQNKGSFANISDVGKIVLCFDASASLLAQPFDKSLAIKLSGLRKTYQNNLHSFEKLLDLDKELTISELCVQLSCTIIKELAENIWKQYKDSHPALSDNNHPLYIVVSVHTACKLKRIKVDKTKLISLSHSSATRFKELENDFQKFVTALNLVKESKSSKGKQKQENNVEEIIGNLDALNIKSAKMSNEHVEGVIEDYEAWKKRILDEAYAALKNQAI